MRILKSKIEEAKRKEENTRGEALKSRSETPLPEGTGSRHGYTHRVFSELKTLSSTDRERSVDFSLFSDAVVAVALYRHMIRIENLNSNPHEVRNFEIFSN